MPLETGGSPHSITRQLGWKPVFSRPALGPPLTPQSPLHPLPSAGSARGQHGSRARQGGALRNNTAGCQGPDWTWACSEHGWARQGVVWVGVLAVGEDSQAPWSFLGLPVWHLQNSGAVPSGRQATTPSFKFQTYFPKKRRGHRVVSATGPLQRLFPPLGTPAQSRKPRPQRVLGWPPCGPLDTHTLARSHTLSRPCHVPCFSSQPCDPARACPLHVCLPWGHGLAPRQCSARPG